MIDPTIIKLTKIIKTGDNCLPHFDDVRIGMELLKAKYYPDMPDEVSKYLYENVAAKIVEEYCEEPVEEVLKWKIG